MPRYLTKSLFTLTLECPAKLYYTKKEHEYANNKLDDPFLESLREGGFQVGELARSYHPGGTMIETLDYDDALRQTNELLQHDNVIIYEAAVKYRNLFIRIDILVKKGNQIDLIEVKSKSTNFRDAKDFLDKDGKYILAKWSGYLYDVAFQKYVTEKAFPGMKIRPFLKLVDKNAVTTVDGLNQKFKIRKVVEGGKERIKVEVAGDISRDELGDKILLKINVDPLIKKIFDGKDQKTAPTESFEERITAYADYYERDEKIPFPIGVHCDKCEFKCTDEDRAAGLKSGFRECWKEQLGWQDEDFDEPLVFEVSGLSSEKFLKQGKYFINDLDEQDIIKDRSVSVGLSNQERQWLQVKKVKNRDESEYFNRDGLMAEVKKWKYPLHFIDFETAAFAIPATKGMHPYEVVSFQFSHHTVDKNGKIEHAGEYLNDTPGEFPSFGFLRHLKAQLENDEGTIFRYSTHENTCLNAIYSQLKNQSAKNIPDRDELIAFIESISHPTNNQADRWEPGERDMVDLCEFERKYYYNPLTKGSNSIKDVLLSVIRSGRFLQEKYSKPVYGSADGIPSRNFKDFTWVRKDNGGFLDPYKILDPLFKDVDESTRSLFIMDEKIEEGGAAATAYARMQLSEMTDEESKFVRKGLLRYCELDTLAMVMIWEHWNSLIINS